MKVIVAVFSASAVLLNLLCGAAVAGEIEDVKAVLALDQAYANNWKNGDEDGVMGLFAEGVVVIPHHGDAPIEGREALRDFWFPKGGSPTLVPLFNHKPASVAVHGDIAIVRGRFELTWIYEGERTEIPEGNYVTIAQRDEGRWEIKLLTWNDDPRRWVKTPAQ